MSRFSISVALFLLSTSTLLLSSCASREEIKKQIFSKEVKSSPAPSARKKTSHVVRKGETLSSIGMRYGVSAEAIKRANGIKDPRSLDVGRRLKIPSGSKATARRGARKKAVSKKAYSRSVRANFSWPLKKFRVSSNFGIRNSVKHDGIDLAARKGTYIMAADGGSVIFSGWGPSGYGRVVIIKHSKRAITLYAHNNRNLVRQGQRVIAGQKIATVGKSGRATGYHLHFEVRIDRRPVDPLTLLPRRR